MIQNQAPEQRARDRIDDQLRASGWTVLGMAELNPAAARGVAVREYPTDTGPMDYLLMVDRDPVGLIEAKREEEGHRISRAEEQSARYANAELRHIGQADLRFAYEATDEITRFTDRGDPTSRVREVFQFHRTETLAGWRARLLKHAGVGRVLFLVDTRNLGVQAENEFHQYPPQDDNRKFTELYTVQRLRSPHVPTDGQVCISTIQRLYSIFKGAPQHGEPQLDTYGHPRLPQCAAAHVPGPAIVGQ